MIKRVGDSVFDGAGRPALVKDREPVTQVLTLERGEEFDAARKYGIINGINPELRSTFQDVMDKVRSTEDPRERVAMLGDEIGKLGEDVKSRQLKKYLTAEMTHIMNSENIQPRVFQLPDDQIR